ncbi:MAG: glutamate racemase [Oscillospiraceae bacterium]|nr:glutamate racemase [Oscillospiraceae bacterium]
MTKRASLPIAVFDSGMGGISVLRELYKLMPYEDYLFFGDSANAPYGGRPVEQVRSLTMDRVAQLLDMGAKAVVVACNTATSAAIVSLREKYPTIPMIGLEPAIKPAAVQNPGGRVLILATELTVNQPKCRLLMERYERTATLIPLSAPGLMEFVERDLLHTDELDAFLRRLLAPYIENPVDAVVLGCTHYPFLRDDIAKVLGGKVKFYDGGAGTARETHYLLEQDAILNDYTHKGQIHFMNSDPSGKSLELSKRLFQL